MSVNTRGVQSDEVKDKVFHALVNPRIPLSDRQEKSIIMRLTYVLTFVIHVSSFFFLWKGCFKGKTKVPPDARNSGGLNIERMQVPIWTGPDVRSVLCLNATSIANVL